MALPVFLGIGAQRSGTTWLHELLESHPDVYVPRRRKEVHFFDWYYDRGLEWYESFFPDGEVGGRRVVGEITPDYLYDPLSPRRIAETLPSVKLIVILRNPVDRAYSHYLKLVRDDNYRGSFEDLIQPQSEVVKRGFYSRYLQEYLQFFSQDKILALIFENAVRDVQGTKQSLAAFLGIEVSRFPVNAGMEKVHRSYVPKARWAYALSKGLARKLHDWDLDFLVRLAKRLGVKRLFGEDGPIPLMKQETRERLRELYAEEIATLESLLQINLSCWKTT